MNVKEILKIDYQIAGYKTDLVSKIRYFFYPNYTISYITCLRKYTSVDNDKGFISFLYSKYLKLKLYRLSAKTGFYIPRDVFGPGVYIPHFGSIVVNPNAKIGSYCLINANVVIGQENGKCPTIGDNCFIGSGAVICGDVKIGNNVWIGANSVVTKSFPENNILIAGVPAKIIAKRNTSWIENFSQL